MACVEACKTSALTYKVEKKVAVTA
jgi:ferredoxin